MSASLFDPPGPVQRRRAIIWNAISIAVIVGIATVAIRNIGQGGGLAGQYWRELYNSSVIRLVWKGMVASAKVAVLGIALSLVWGVALACGKLSSHRWIRWPARAAVEVLRGLPILILIFLLYLGLPSMGIVIPALAALVGGIAVYNGALIGEIIRGGVVALPAGQREAAYSLGMSRFQTMSLILLPQAIRAVLPAIVSQMVVVVKESSLGFVVGYIELLQSVRTAHEILGPGYGLPLFLLTAVIYVTVNSILGVASRRLSARGGGRRRAARPDSAFTE